jgi:galactose mutarotase-like enzyme
MLSEIKNNFISVKIDTLGAEVKSLQACGEYIWQGGGRFWDGSAPNLFPITGRLKDGRYTIGGKSYEMQIHGFIRRREFEITSKSDSAVTLVSRSDGETLIQYPFDFIFEVAYALIGRTLNITYRVTNNSLGIMPFAVGAHFGFITQNFSQSTIKFRQAPTEIILDDKTLLCKGGAETETANGIINLGKAMFALHARAYKDTGGSLEFCGGGKAGAVKIDYPDMPHIVLWTHPGKDAQFVCIEPWTGMNSGENEGYDLMQKQKMLHLPPGQIYSNKWSISISE